MARIDRHEVLDLVPGLDQWEIVNGSWVDTTEEEGGASLQMSDFPLAVQLASPVVSLDKDSLYSFRVSGIAEDSGRLCLALVGGEDIHVPYESWLRTREVDAAGEFVGSFAFLAPQSGNFRLLLGNGTGAVEEQGARLSGLDFRITKVGPVETELFSEPPNTYLPHWSGWQRKIHDKCKASRSFNGLVQAVEMKLDREEVLSLPAFVALCPTGQCNALCDFCSVTINRTGIIKRQLPWENLARFLHPVRNVLQMCGLEGNGEPTLYKQFDELLGYVKQEGTEVYLITNGSRLMPSQIPHVLGLNSVTFSMNAASAETHRKVMKLKNWPDVVRNVRSIVAERGNAANPIVNLSFVAYNYNIHELQDFLQFAEHDLKADKLVIRPLSELGTDTLGTIEDLRDIVPYESDVQDAIDAVGEYLQDVPRRQYTNEFGHQACEISFDASAFRNVRPDPSDKVVLPKGFEGRLLAPRRGDWTSVGDGVRASWHLAKAHLICDDEVPGGVVWYSAYTPVDPNSEVVFKCRVMRHFGAAFAVQVVNEAGLVIGEQSIAESPTGEGADVEVCLPVDTADNKQLSLQVARESGSFWAEIDFERTRTPGAMVRSEFKVPNARRWAVDDPEAQAEWSDSTLTIAYPGGSSGYLFKSYFAPCIAGEPIVLPVSVEVKGGPVVLGVLDEGAQSWITQFVFEGGRSETELTIDPGDNRKIQFVVFSRTGAAFEARFEWGETIEQEAQRHGGGAEESVTAQAVLDVLDYADLAAEDVWSLSDPDVSSLSVNDGALALQTNQDTGAMYIVRSRPIPVPRNSALDLSWSLGDGSQDHVVVGVLDQTENSFLVTAPASEPSLNVQTGENETATLVMYSADGSPVDVALSFDAVQREHSVVDVPAMTYSDSAVRLTEAAAIVDTPSVDEPPMEGDPEEASEAEVMADDLETSGKVVELPPVDFRELTSEELQDIADRRKKQPRKDGLLRRMFGRRSKKYFCQKPWTDLNNFSIDGRMDVCCMTTGASQSQFALGNILEDDFQAIWNGPAMREFRRTVNTDAKLPPCDRCAMAYSYSGLFFARNHTLSFVKAWFDKRYPNGGTFATKMHRFAEWALERFHFRDFR